jgi:hypothetical protein
MLQLRVSEKDTCDIHLSCDESSHIEVFAWYYQYNDMIQGFEKSLKKVYRIKSGPCHKVLWIDDSTIKYIDHGSNGAKIMFCVKNILEENRECFLMFQDTKIYVISTETYMSDTHFVLIAEFCM